MKLNTTTTAKKIEIKVPDGGGGGGGGLRLMMVGIDGACMPPYAMNTMRVLDCGQSD